MDSLVVVLDGPLVLAQFVVSITTIPISVSVIRIQPDGSSEFI